MPKQGSSRAGIAARTALFSILIQLPLLASASPLVDSGGQAESFDPSADGRRGTEASPARIQGLQAAIEEAKLTASDGSAGDLFGYAVSLSGDRALIGAIQDDQNGSNSGAAYVFEFDGAGWSQTAKLTPSDGAANEGFGFSVGLAEDRALVSARFNDEGGVAAGAVYVFEFNGIDWVETAKLTPGDGAGGDLFGHALSLSGDRVLVGARDDDTDLVGAGSAYVFEFDGSSWVETAKLTASDAGASDQFGQAVSLSGDRALVGASNNDESGNGAGAAYVFEFDGTTWNQVAKLLASDGSEFDFFGISVSLFGDRVAVGADREDAAASNAGAVYVFEHDGSGWIETAKLLASDGALDDRFGISTDLQADRLFVGAYLDDDTATDTGAVYVFDFDAGSWSETARLSAADAGSGDRLGVSVAASGHRILAGAYFDDDVGINEGSAYLFAFNRPPVAQDDALIAVVDTPLAANVFAGNGNGFDVDPDGDSLVVQSPGSFTAGGIGGTVDLAGNGDFTYTPPSGVLGIATFDYTIEDPGGVTDSATVTIDVRMVEIFEDRFES
jgi:hypothetical protein